MKKISKKITVTLMALLILCCTLSTGCKEKIYFTTGLNDNQLFKISGKICTVGQLNLVLYSIMEEYEEVFGEDIWGQALGDKTMTEEIKDQAFANLLDLYCITLMAEKENVILNNDEKIAITAAANSFYNSLSEETIATLAITKEDVETLYTAFYLTKKQYNSYTSNLNIEISDSAARVIEVQSIYLKTFEYDAGFNKVPYSEEKTNEIYRQACDIRIQIENGADFSTLALKYSDDETLDYVFGKGVMVEAYEMAAFALSNEEVSDVVITEDGYYIIKCIKDYLENETAQNKESLVKKYKDDVFLEVFNPYKKTLSYELNDKVWEAFDASAENVDITGFYQKYYELVEVN
ncbi:MAG: hypothetical protein E7266_07150 [Lachnospiraceae bacterium]|nr:hypothetical protein [Lachnospiraceae bacterium]